MCEFQVHLQAPFAGSSYLPAEISLCPLQSYKKYLLSGNDSRLAMEVGVLSGDKMTSTGQAGWLIFGPYLPLMAGQHQVLFRCTVGESGLAGAYMDVAADKANRVLVEYAFEEPDDAGCFIVRPILLNTSCADLEVRGVRY